MQTAAEEAVADFTAEAGRLGANCVALVAIRPDGALLAMVGGFDYTTSQQNCAEARRQTGSSFKFITLAAAVQAGFRGDYYLEDVPISVKTQDGEWRPDNYGDDYYGWITLQDALAYSANTAAVQLGYRVGLDRVIGMARRAGLEGRYSAAHPAFLLGAIEETPFDMAVALARLTSCDTAELHVFPSAQSCAPILRGRDLAVFNSIAAAPMQYGTGRAADFGENCIGKTGTTNNHRDAWFIGRCGEIVTAVWVGRRDNRPIRMTGGQTPARIWRAFMRDAARIDARRD
jgi:membrane peptidoglycan carboxypeptidase